jgi:hypothetical protein
VHEEILEVFEVHQLSRAGNSNHPTVRRVRIRASPNFVPHDFVDHLAQYNKLTILDHVEELFGLISVEKYDLGR